MDDRLQEVTTRKKGIDDPELKVNSTTLANLHILEFRKGIFQLSTVWQEMIESKSFGLLK